MQALMKGLLFSHSKRETTTSLWVNVPILPACNGLKKLLSLFSLVAIHHKNMVLQLLKLKWTDSTQELYLFNCLEAFLTCLGKQWDFIHSKYYHF